MKKMTLNALIAMLAAASLGGSPAMAEKTATPEKTTAPAKAEKTAKTDKAAKGPKPAKMTCQEFLELDDVVKPKVVYWSEGFNRKGKPEDAVFDVEETDRLVPVMVEVCQKAPKESFWQKVKAEFKKVF